MLHKLTIISGLLLLTACSNSGTKEYTNPNTIKLFDSWENSQKATRLINTGELYVNIDTKEVLDIQAFKKIALQIAISIPDDYLDDVHVNLKDHFRNEYQRSLQLSIEAYDEGDNLKSIQGSNLLSKWADWHNLNKKKTQEGLIKLETN